jgi:hypothetical protein
MWGYLYKFVDTESVLKVGERSICMCANAGIKFTPIEFEAMRILEKKWRTKDSKV